MFYSSFYKLKGWHMEDKNSQSKKVGMSIFSWKQEYKEIKKSKVYDKKTKKQLLKHAKQMQKKNKDVDF